MPGSVAPYCAVRNSAIGTSTAAPISGPHSVPTPPNRQTISAWADVNMPNTAAGVTSSSTTAYSPPAAAANAPLTTIAASLSRNTATPAARAAASSSLIAARRRPNAERSIASDTPAVTSISASATSPSQRGSSNCIATQPSSRRIGSDTSWNPPHSKT